MLILDWFYKEGWKAGRQDGRGDQEGGMKQRDTKGLTILLQPLTIIMASLKREGYIRTHKTEGRNGPVGDMGSWRAQARRTEQKYRQQKKKVRVK
jgi:hypothetical protein